jgi:hypothetical protein
VFLGAAAGGQPTVGEDAARLPDSEGLSLADCEAGGEPVRVLNAVASSCHWLVSRVIVAADNPASEPRNWVSAGAQSLVDRPCR